MDLGIAGKWALVCGASKELGFGCAQALVREGVNVVLVADAEEALEAAVQKLLADPARPPETVVQQVAGDITTAEKRAEVLELRRGYDIVVTNAGELPRGDFRNWDHETWIKALDANMLTPIELIKATVDGMAARGFGRIINILPSAADAPIDTLGLSDGASSSLTGFVADLARTAKLASANVTINNLVPRGFDTDAGRSKTTGEPIEADFDARRPCAPSEFGAACAFLCSMHAGYITGQNV